MTTTESAVPDQDFRRRVGRIEGLVAEIQRCPDPSLRVAAEEVIRAVLDLHREGIGRIVDRLRGTGEQGTALLALLAADDLVGSLLVLHGIHPQALEVRVRGALDTVRPRIHKQGREVDLVAIDGDAVLIRLVGRGGGCAGSGDALRRGVEHAVLAAAPDVARIDFEEPGAAPAPPAGLVPLPMLAGDRAAVPAGRP